MKPSLLQLTAFYARSLIYKNCKYLAEKLPGDQLWLNSDQDNFENRFANYQKWLQEQNNAIAHQLTDGRVNPTFFQLAALNFRSFLFKNFKWLFNRCDSYKQWRMYRKEAKAIQIAARLQWLRSNDDPYIASLLKGTAEEAENIKLPRFDKPTVSVLIPVYNKIAYTLTCLQSIGGHLPLTSFEVIVIDDCSTDDTQKLVSKVSGVRLLRNESNCGFLMSCNKAAEAARGEYLLFLNNDTEVMPGWLDELLWIFHNYPDAGLAGSKLIYPTGLQQEAGGIIWSDAKGTNYGRGANPERPEFCYVREVDYCSGASIMIPRELFQSLGGFDKRYIPAYYEDTDLAFSVRNLNRRVFFQPFSKIIHYEGITSGTDITKGVKAYQVKNQIKFLEKWRPILSSHGILNRNIRFAKERGVMRRALIIDASTPTPDQDSGSIDALYYIQIIQKLGYKITFAPTSLIRVDRYTEALQRMGVECLYAPHIGSINEHLQSLGADYDLVILNRARVAARHIKQVRKYCTKAKIIFNTVDLHYLREERQAEIQNSSKLKRRAKRTKASEHAVMQLSDATIVISDTERVIIEKERPDIRVAAIPYIREVKECKTPYSARRDIIFIGSFDHAPNVDAVSYFATEIWPLIHSSIPETKFRIIGSKARPEIEALELIPGIVFEGYIADLDQVFNNCRLSVAPLRFGAGIKGKIGTSLSYGVPCIATPIAAEGMQLVNEQDIVIASSPSEFANAVVASYLDEVLWNRLSTNGIEFMKMHYSFERGLKSIKELIDSIDHSRTIKASKYSRTKNQQKIHL